MKSINQIGIKVIQGTIIGCKSQLPNGDLYYYFKGIPYAKPPIGELRFKVPQRLENFEKPEIDCSEEQNVSFHRDLLTNEYVGSEDCLYLNVYAPAVTKNELLPVMIWIHGGSFQMGSGNSDIYNPVYLVQENVIVVTINYRLGIFGFLSFPEGGIPANIGLKDQLMALKWVKDNIQSFNGDPNNITLFGESAGGASVHMHVLSANSKQFFHKAILQSGTANMDWAIQKNASYKAKRLAELLGLKKLSNDKEVGEFLRSYPNPLEMYRYFYRVFTKLELKRDVMMPYRPCIESNSEEAIVESSFSESVKNSNIDIPIIMGCSSSEGIINLQTEIRHLDKFNMDPLKIVPYRIPIELNDPRLSKLSEQIKQFYFGGKKVSEENLDCLVDLMTDTHFAYEFFTAVKEHSKYQRSSPLFVYRFSFVGDMNLYKKITGFGHLKGACHADELFYIFQQKLMGNDVIVGTLEEKILKTMCRMWANFAKYGDPTPKNDDVINFKWKPVKQFENDETFKVNFLEIDKNIKMENGMWQERMEFWRKIDEIYCDARSKAKL